MTNLVDCYTYSVSLSFRPEHNTLENAERLADMLFTKACAGDDPRIEEVNGVLSVVVVDAYYAANDFEMVLINGGFIEKLEDVVWECAGFGQVYYYRIQDGKMEECGTIQKPDEKWIPCWLVQLQPGREHDQVLVADQSTL